MRWQKHPISVTADDRPIRKIQDSQNRFRQRLVALSEIA